MNNALTEENIKKLREELDYRLTVKRAEIAKEKMVAAAHGDRSENAEYKEACANYRENDNRIQYLLTMITTATVIEDKNEETVVSLVTTVDVDPEHMCISIESDLGKALTGRSAGELVEVDAPRGKYSVEILEII